jgi:crossover junction endodeoxyribonuclease RusA
MTDISFVTYTRPEPQGSMKGFVRQGKPVVTSDNPKMRPYRDEVTRNAVYELAKANLPRPLAGKHVPVSVVYDFHFSRPPSIPKKRHHVVVKPDFDKLARSTTDALTGVLYVDDAQIVEASIRKHYGTPERVEISVTVLEE